MLLRKATSADFKKIKALLQLANLVLEGIEQTNFWVLFDEENLIATAGLEIYGQTALLRSVAVVSSRHGEGKGGLIVQKVLADATSLGIEEIILLTETAENFFMQFGFTKITRADVPNQLKASVEFQGACPESAFVMRFVYQP